MSLAIAAPPYALQFRQVQKAERERDFDPVVVRAREVSSRSRRGWMKNKDLAIHCSYRDCRWRVCGSCLVNRGFSGDHVLALQVELATRCFPWGKIDGVLGPASCKALVIFQRLDHLVPDGMVDKRTRMALGIQSPLEVTQNTSVTSAPLFAQLRPAGDRYNV